MERKIGETFYFEGHKLKVIERKVCEGCFFARLPCEQKRYFDVHGYCAKSRTDDHFVKFIEITPMSTRKHIKFNFK